jgi:hypothetical protein
MSLKKWLDNGWLRRHQTSSKEISDLFDELIDFVAGMENDVWEWLKEHHPDLI